MSITKLKFLDVNHNDVYSKIYMQLRKLNENKQDKVNNSTSLNLRHITSNEIVIVDDKHHINLTEKIKQYENIINDLNHNFEELNRKFLNFDSEHINKVDNRLEEINSNFEHKLKEVYDNFNKDSTRIDSEIKKNDRKNDDNFTEIRQMGSKFNNDFIKIDSEVKQMGSKFNNDFTEIKKMISNYNNNFTKIDGEIKKMDGKFDNNFTRVNNEITKIDGEIKKINSKFNNKSNNGEHVKELDDKLKDIKKEFDGKSIKEYIDNSLSKLAESFSNKYQSIDKECPYTLKELSIMLNDYKTHIDNKIVNIESVYNNINKLNTVVDAPKNSFTYINIEGKGGGSPIFTYGNLELKPDFGIPILQDIQLLEIGYICSSPSEIKDEQCITLGITIYNQDSSVLTNTAISFFGYKQHKIIRPHIYIPSGTNIVISYLSSIHTYHEDSCFRLSLKTI